MTTYRYLDLGNKIKEIRESLGLTQQQFADKLGVPSQANISRYEKGMMPPPAILKKIANQGNISIEKLLSLVLNSNRGFSLDNIRVDPFISHLDNDFVHLTVYRLTGAGNEMDNVDYEPVGSVAIPKYIYQPYIIPFKVVGDSMEKLIMENSIILVDTKPQGQLIEKKIYCFRIPYAGFIIRVVNPEPDGLFLEPYNKQYDPRKIPWEEFNNEIVVGRVICNVINYFR